MPTRSVEANVAKPLVIVESKAKADTIAGFLGRDRYTVKPSVGHIRDLPQGAKQAPKTVTKPQVRRLGIDVDDHFRPVYIVPDNKKHVVAELKAALKDASEVYLATDEDREGEAISWHLLEVLKPKVPVKRMVFHEITEQAIADAIDNWRELDMKLVEAQEGRRILDRLVGYEVSNVAFRRIGRGTSVGRVQSVATRLVVDRERARMAFRSGQYWDLEGTFHAHEQSFPATLVDIDGKRLALGRDFDPDTGALKADSNVALLDEGAVVALAARLDGVDFTVASVDTKQHMEKPKAPFITSTLQQEAGRKLGFSAGRTMSIAQGLYERGLITYMRTDSTSLSEQAVSAARRQIASLYGDAYLPAQPREYRSKVKNAQEAHEAIRPAGDRMRTADDVGGELRSSDERRLYDLIWKRTVASQMADARIQRVTLKLGATSTANEQVTFQASGRTIEFPGYLRAYVEGADDPEAELEDRETILPPLQERERVDCQELRPAGHTTQPPARFTEASLVKELEERGIGRPSTYVSVIETILARDYVFKKGTALVPTWKAFAKVQLLERYFSHLIDYTFTATMEEALDAVARGEGEAEKWLDSFYFGNGTVGLRELVSDERLAQIDMAEVNSVHVGVDAQGNELIVRVWPNGARIERGDEKAPIPVDLAPDELTPEKAEELLAKGGGGPRELGTDPETGLTVLVLSGRFGPFVQLGEQAEGSKEKPKRASLFASMEPDTVTLDEALQLLALPRVVGTDTDGEEITAQNGRYGPYIKKGTDSRSLGAESELFTVTLEQAQAIFAQPKQRRGRVAKPPIAELGLHPDSGAPVRVLDGRFGPYITDGTTNATVPRGIQPDAVTLNEAVELLAERAARGPAKKKAPAKRTTAKKTAAKKPASTTTRTVKKGTTAKKAAAKQAARSAKKPPTLGT
ncbi:MAG: type I DNA topoisomerase [Acidimicrobiia bacterium]